MIKKFKKTMGMTAIVCLNEKKVNKEDINRVFSYFEKIDKQFSTYKKTSETECINRGEIEPGKYSREMKKILSLSEKTRQETAGYFNVYNNGRLDPSGIVKGYAIHQATKMLKKNGYNNLYLEIGGDVDVYGKSQNGGKWKVGISNPFSKGEIVKVLHVSNRGVATSGTAVRGTHIYNPHNEIRSNKIVSITVVGPNVYDADRMATAAFAMGLKGISFIESQKGFEGFAITADKQGISTSGLSKYLN